MSTAMFIKFIKSIFAHNKRDPSDSFIQLLQIAKDDKSIRDIILYILSLDTFNRESFLKTWLNELNMKGAPNELIRAIEPLLSDDVAKKLLKMLKDDPSSKVHLLEEKSKK